MSGDGLTLYAVPRDSHIPRFDTPQFRVVKEGDVVPSVQVQKIIVRDDVNQYTDWFLRTVLPRLAPGGEVLIDEVHL